MDNSDALHVVVLPFIRFSHLNPFLQLSKRLAGLGHRVSFLSTPATSRPSPPPPPPCPHSSTSSPSTTRPPAPTVTTWIPSETPSPASSKACLLHRTGSSLTPATTGSSSLHADLGVPCCYVNIVSAAANVFMWPFFAQAADGEAARVTVERLTAPPDWIPFPTSIKLHRHEARQLLSVFFRPSMSGWTNGFRVGSSVQGSDLVEVASCAEFEPEWIAALPDLFGKPVLPLGHFAASAADNNTNAGRSNGDPLFEWLDGREAGSVVYVAFGSEAAMSKVIGWRRREKNFYT